MALERQTIEKKDFPIGRRGYDPEAVDAHLHSLADEIEDLKRSSRRRSETLASAASEQVRAIVEAAETSAAEIHRQAEQDAQEIRSDADNEARTTREEATAQAREFVGRVSESTAGMLKRVDAMESELGTLLEALRTGANRLNADLQLLEGNIGEVRESVAPRGRFEPEASASPAASEAESSLGAADADAGEAEMPEPEPGDEPSDESSGQEAAAASGDGAASETGEPDGEGARLIALNMALNGTPREETEQYLAENFELADRAALLDEVYSSIEG